MSSSTEKFIGRSKELGLLANLANQKKSSLVVIRGRRRVGKSRLAKEFSKDKFFLSFSGLAPNEGMTAQHQRDHFVEQLLSQVTVVRPVASDWYSLFLVLAQQLATKKNKVLLLDEISWMSTGDPTFLPKLKSIWDDYLSQQPNLVLILCGSVSSWIDTNILSSTDFFGRITETITLDELSLPESIELLSTRGFTGSVFEKMMTLSITGGIPWYIELLAKASSASSGIMRACFSKDGVLVREFERIFNDLFSRRAEAYAKIIRAVEPGVLSHQEIADKEAYPSSGVLSEYLNDLVLSGFLAEDQNWSLQTGMPQKLKTYRLKDNYLRFYLRYIEPNLPRINKNLFEDTPLSSLKGLPSLMGLQFENLMLHNRRLLYEKLGIHVQDIVFDNPYLQKKTARQSACQIDLLIQTRLGVFYLCEMKLTTQTLGIDVIDEVKTKVSVLKMPRGTSIVPVLVYLGELSEALQESDYFLRTINAREWFC